MIKSSLTCLFNVSSVARSRPTLSSITFNRYVSTADILLRKRKKSKDSTKLPKGLSVRLPPHEIDRAFDCSEMLKEMNSNVEWLSNHYTGFINLQASAGTFSKLTISTEDGSFKLNQIANISEESPSLMIVTVPPHSVQYIKQIKSAIQNSGHCDNPQVEKNSIFIQISKITREHRERLAKSAKMSCGTAKERLKKIEAKYSKKAKLKTLQSLGFSDDYARALGLTILAYSHEYREKIDELCKTKESELLEETK